MTIVETVESLHLNDVARDCILTGHRSSRKGKSRVRVDWKVATLKSKSEMIIRNAP